MRFIWFFLLLLFSYSVVGQADVITKKGSNYFYKGKTYPYKRLGHIYDQYQPAMDFYESALKNKTRAKTLGYIGLGLLAAGVLIADEENKALLLYGLVAIQLGLIVELVALAHSFAGGVKLNKAMDSFNFEMIKRHGYKSNISLSFGTTVNGLGFVFKF